MGPAHVRKKVSLLSPEGISFRLTPCANCVELASSSCLLFLLPFPSPRAPLPLFRTTTRSNPTVIMSYIEIEMHPIHSLPFSATHNYPTLVFFYHSSRLNFQLFQLSLSHIHADLRTDSSIMFDYKVAELTWENGQLAIQGLGPPRPSSSPKHTWEKPRAGGTLESIVDHATCLPPHKGDDGLLPPWFKLNRHPSATANDALVPCSKPTHSVDDDDDTRVPDPHPTRGAFSTCERREGSAARKRRRVAVGDEGSASRHVRKETCETDLEASFGSHEPTSLGKTLSSRTRTTTRDDRDSICHSTPQKREEDSEDGNKRKMERFCNSTNRSRTAAVHNQSERKRRDRINQRMKTLQQLVPNSSKTDKASMLDEAIQYLKQLQAQVQMMSKMSSLSLLQLMMPTPMHQLQMSMMAQMGMMGAMDMNRINRTSQVAPAVPPMLHPAAFFPLTAGWGSGDRLMPPPGSFLAHPPSTAFLACQAQPHNLDAYGRMAALYQQLYQSIGVAPPISKT